MTEEQCKVCAIGFAASLVVIVSLVIILVASPEPPPQPDYSKLPLVTDNAWDSLTPGSWQWTRRTGSSDPTVASQASAPVSPDHVMQMPFEGTQPDTEPVVFWHPLPGSTEVYYEYWFRVSPNWECNPAGCGKLSFLFPASGGDTYLGIYCMDPPYGACSDSASSPMRVGGQLQWGDYGGTPVMPNVRATPIVRDQWVHLAAYYRWSTNQKNANGIWRWWVNGELNGDFTDVVYAIDPAIEFQFAVTKQRVPDPPNQFAWFDHVIVRATGSAPLRRTPRPRLASN